MPVSRPTVRVFWSDGAFASMRTRHSADGLVARGAGEWVPLDAICGESAQADAGAAGFLGVEQEQVVRLHEDPPTREVMEEGVRIAMAQGARRDAVAAATPMAKLHGHLGLFVQTGRSPSEECWRTAVEPQYRRFRSCAAAQSVASQAAGGPRSPVRFPSVL